MKPYLIIVVFLALLSCGKKPHTDQDDLVSEWSQDGKTMTIKRKGLPIASFRNISNACYIQLSGTDVFPDVSVTYREDESTELAPAPENIMLAWMQGDGTQIKSVAYDSDGNQMESDKSPAKK
jgi:hypothetical protein